MDKTLKIGLVQFIPVWENKIESSKKIVDLMKNKKELDLLIFPEMSLTGFTMKSKDFAEETNGETFNFFSSVAKKYRCAVLFGVIEKGKKKNFNSLVHLNSQGKVLKIYRKIHPFSYSKEDVFYGKGKKAIVTKIKSFLTGLSICYDLRFPELYRLYGKEKVHLIVNIANWPDTRIEHWRTLLKARAIENQCYVVGVNRTGDDPALHYNGFSSVFDPTGKEIISLENEERIIEVEIQKSCVDEVRKKFPFLKDIKLV